MPVWHASVSLWDGITEAKLRSPGVCERAAVRLLGTVGGDREWWVWRSGLRVGHLRVALTAEEFARCPPGVGGDTDAGESGPERRRRKS